MNKNVKRIFFVLTLVTLLATVGAVCAADDTNSTTASDSSVSDTTISDTSSDTVAAEPATKTSNNKVDTKTIEKNDKNIKKDPVTIDGITYTNIIENKEINEYTSLNEKSYINNLTITVEGDYGLDILADSYINNSNINAYLYNEKLLSINNSYISHASGNYGGNLRIYNSVITDNFFNSGFMTLNNTTILGVITSNSANLYITNSILNSTIKVNGGNITIDENTILGENFSLENTNGNIYTNNTQYLSLLEKNGLYYNDKTLENINITFNITNNANMQLINCNITNKITNNGNLTLINCSLSNNNLTNKFNDLNGMLICNNGQVNMINCIMENNTFNNVSSYNTGTLYGPIINNGIMNVVNSSFHNNTLGYTQVTENNAKGVAIGRGGTIVNKNTLFIENSNFTENYAGDRGGAIYNERGNVTITESIFYNNTATLRGGVIDTTGGKTNITNTEFKNNGAILEINELIDCGGGAISSNKYAHEGTLYIENCTFEDNYAICKVTGLLGVESTGGAILSNSNNTIINKTTFKNNYAQKANTLNLYSNTTSIDSRFENVNSNRSKEVILGNPTLINNTFTNISNVDYILHTTFTSYDNYNNIIARNNFTNNNANIETIYYDSDSSELTAAELLKQQNITAENNNYQNTTINDTLDLIVPNKIYAGEPVTITGTYQINNPSFYDSDILEQNKFNIYINGVLNQTVDTLEFTITPTNGTMMVTVQPTISQTRKTTSIRATTLSNIVITPENYNEFIYEGVLIGVGKDSKIIFQGEFTNKENILIDTENIIIDGTNATFTNTTFTLDSSNTLFQNMKINNTNTTYPITNLKENNTITQNTITLTNSNGKTAAIYNQANNTNISNNTIYIDGPAGDIDFTDTGVATTQAILLLGANNNTIEYNNITITSSQTGTTFGTIEGITNSKQVNNTLIQYNNINVSGGRFNYAINGLNTAENITIKANNITVTGERYTDGIQLGNGANNNIITQNNINLTCLNTTQVDEAAISYGIIITNQGSTISNNNTITENNININGAVNYGIEIYTATNTNINNNNITLTGVKSMGIGYAHSPNSTITQNTITTNDDSTQPLNGVTEEIQPASTGIKIQQDSDNIQIENNTITTNDTAKTDKTIDTEDANTTIKNNKLTSSTGYGTETIKTTQTDTLIENNTIETTTTLEVPETIIINTPVELTATVTIDETPINGGTITFTKDDEVLAQATVTDGVATATVTFKEAEDTTITATYTPESTGLSTSSAEAATSIQAPVTQLKIENVNLTAGETVTLTATVTDQAGNSINGGKVTFKVNGKTVKDANGKVVYAKVVDGVATVDYTVPESLAGKDINITVVYSGSNKYNKESITITKTVATPEPTLTITPITEDIQTGSTITLKAKVAAGDKTITTGKIVFKINGKTVKDANGKVIYAKVVNNSVEFEYTLPESMKVGSYNITATFIAPGYDRLEAESSLTVVKT